MVKARGEINNMNLTANRSRIELIIGSVATIVTGAMCGFGSVVFGKFNARMYGADAEFALVTRIALTAHLWCPILLGGALVVFLRFLIRQPENRKPFGVLMALNLFVTLVSGYGFFEPMLRATIPMGHR